MSDDDEMAFIPMTPEASKRLMASLDKALRRGLDLDEFAQCITDAALDAFQA